MKLFLLDVGNTHTRYGYYEDGKFTLVDNWETGELQEMDFPTDVPVAGATVVPEVKDKLSDKNIFWIDNETESGIDLSLVEAHELGPDRLANLVAMADYSDLPAMIIDNGTALTVEVLTADKKFFGGIIAPGRTLLRRSLHNYTSLLPFVPVTEDKARTFGRDTKDSIILGCDLGIIGAVKEYIDYTKRVLDAEYCSVYAAGGDAEFLMKNISGISPVPDNLTLRGIAKIWELNHSG